MVNTAKRTKRLLIKSSFWAWFSKGVNRRFWVKIGKLSVIIFCWNRVRKDDWRCSRRLNWPKKTLWFFQKELTHDFESKFESCIFCNSLDRVRRHDDTNKQTNDCKACWTKMDNQKGIVYPLAWLLYPTVTCNCTTFPLLVRPLQSFPAQHEKNYAKNHACTTNGIPVKQWLCHLLLHEALGRHVTGIQEPDWNKCYAMGNALFIHKGAWVGAWNVSANNSETVGHKYLRLGQIVYILVFYNISFSWLLPLDGFQFILRDNDPLVFNDFRNIELSESTMFRN